MQRQLPKAARRPTDPDRIPSSNELSGQMQRKLLLLASGMTLVIAVTYVGYFAVIGLWISAGRGVLGVAMGLGVLGYGLYTRNYEAALNVLSFALFGTFAVASYFQDGVFSPALWWMLTPPIISVLAGSLKTGGLLFAGFLLHTGVLYWHGPGSWGSVSLMARDRNLQMALTVVFSTVFMCVFVGMGRYWLQQVQKTLEQARTAAQVAMEVKARFLSNMSHEIRTPLNGMIGATEMLRSQKMSGLQRRQLVMVQEQSAKMLMSLVNDILDFSKLEAGKVRIERAHTRLRPLIFNVNELFSVAAFERGIELTSSYAADVPELMLADPTRLRQIVSNLVSNAVKFTERGGVHIHLSLSKEIANPQRAPGFKWVRFDISDTGPGIEEKLIPALFKPFEQADGSITRRYGGTGLGLSISIELAQLMKGRIDVVSRVGQGSMFSLIVPLEVAGPPPEAVEYKELPGRLMVVTRTEGLWRHLKVQLDEIGVRSLRSEHVPSTEEAYRARAAYVLIDEPLAQVGSAEMRRMLDQLVDDGVRVAVIAPLGGDKLVRTHERVALLYKPVRRSSLKEFVFGDELNNIRESHATPRNQDSVFSGLDSIPPEPDAAFGERPTVLIVEDNPVNQIVVRAMLIDAEVNTVVVSNGADALELLSAQPIDLVLMDIQMPGMDGITATRLLRQRGSNVPVVAMTGNNEADDGNLCSDAGMDAFLSKPFTQQQLREVLMAHLPRVGSDPTRQSPQ